MELTLEKTILKNLINTETFTRKILPFLKADYFSSDDDRTLFNEISHFILKYNAQPTYDALFIEIDSISNLTETQAKTLKSSLESIQSDLNETNQDWLVDSTEKFCQERAIYLGLMEAIDIMNNKNSKLQKGAIPQILSDALAVSFDPNVGHSYTEDFESRYEYYHRKESRVPFDLDFLNKITSGGLPRKTLSVFMAGVGVGKSLCMCHCAAACLNQGKNVLYITLELAEEEVAKRIDANLMNATFADLMGMPKDLYLKKVSTIGSKTNGRLIIKEYPTANASVTHFRALLNELSLKKSFRPDIIFIDYLNICTSSRVKMSESNSYLFVKSIAEEIRGLAVEYNLPIVSATQVNRSGYNNSDFGMENVSESFGLPATVDLLLGIIATEDLDKLGQIMIKQIKNRLGDPSVNKRFVLGIDRCKMKLFDVELSAQSGISESSQISEETQSRKDKFKSLKV